MSESLGPPDATARDAEQLLRAWFHWFRTSHEAPGQITSGLHLDTAAYLTVRALQDGRKIYGPHDL